MQCSEVKRRLETYLADELEGPELRAMIAHLATCPECRHQAEAADPVKIFVPLAVRELEDEDRWEGFWEGIAGKLDARSRRAGRLIPWPGSMRWVAAAGAVAATVLVGLFFAHQKTGPVGMLPGETAPATASAFFENDAGGLVESIYIDQIAEALPARLIERSGEVRALRLTRVDERSVGSVNHYRAGGEAVPATVSHVQLEEQMASIIEYSLVIAGDAGEGEAEEVRVVSFESEQFPFGCERAQDPE